MAIVLQEALRCLFYVAQARDITRPTRMTRDDPCR